MSIVLQGSTSGSITLQEPAIAGNTVLSLPATSGTLITTGSSGQVIPKAALPTGSVLQVVSASTNSVTSTTSTSYVASNVSASITPTSSTSRILIIASVNLFISAATGEPHLTIYRNNTTNLSDNTGLVDFFNPAGSLYASASMNLLDSPATTSSTTYTVYVRRDTTGTATINQNSATSVITLLEIAA